MKKIFISFIITCLLVIQLSSCKKIIASVFKGLDVNVPELQVTIPAIIAVNPNEISLGSFSYKLNLDSIIKANTAGVFGINAVSSIKVKQVSVTITNADQLNNLSNFESVRVMLQSNNNITPVQLLSATFADTYATSYITNPTNSPELLSYLKGSDITNNVYGKIRRITNKPLNMVIAVTIRVN